MTGRVLALDVGTRRLGVAVSDPSGTVASPLATVPRRTPAETPPPWPPWPPSSTRPPSSSASR